MIFTVNNLSLCIFVVFYVFVLCLFYSFFLLGCKSNFTLIVKLKLTILTTAKCIVDDMTWSRIWMNKIVLSTNSSKLSKAPVGVFNGHKMVRNRFWVHRLILLSAQCYGSFSSANQTWVGRFVNMLPCLHSNSHTSWMSKTHTTHNQQNHHPKEQMLSLPQLITFGSFAWMLMGFLRKLQPSAN